MASRLNLAIYALGGFMLFALAGSLPRRFDEARGFGPAPFAVIVSSRLV
jgi:hypothetical protein